ncbi:hypothetical protein GGI43DRAFT_77642 [Trichoderma evansii]
MRRTRLRREIPCKRGAAGANPINRKNRRREGNTTLSIFLRCVGSGDTVPKFGDNRDVVANQHWILVLMIESGTIWDALCCVVVKAAVCDYADSHKNKKWQDFAVATSVSVTKALLERYVKADAAF